MLSTVKRFVVLASKEKKKKNNFFIDMTFKKYTFLLTISINITHYSFGQYPACHRILITSTLFSVVHTQFNTISFSNRNSITQSILNTVMLKLRSKYS